MTDTWATAAAVWGTRSDARASGMTRDCPSGSSGDGGSGGSGGGGSGGVSGDSGAGHCGGCCCQDRGYSDDDLPEPGDCTGLGDCTSKPRTHDPAECPVHRDRLRGDRHRCHCHRPPGEQPHGPGGRADSGSTGTPVPGTSISWRNPNRPGHHCGTSTAQVPGGRLDPCDFGTPPWNQWPGQRGDLYLPFLFLRANAGDLGARPVVGPFWESPDVLLVAGADPAVAPAIPPELGQTALAGRPNTLYAHVWNFGIAQAPNVVVEFYWCDPSLGIGPAGAHLIGYGEVALGARGSARSHAVVKCPVAWVPTFLNGGHECLLVRAWDQTSDGLGTPPWDAALNRHIGQRNIHVIAPGAGASARAAAGPALLADLIAPLTLKVGPLYGEPAQVTVARVAPHDMPWLQQRTGTRGVFPIQAVPTGALLLSSPTTIGGGPTAGGPANSHDVSGDDQQVTLSAGDAMPSAGQAHVYRVTAAQQGQVFGGYTVVLLG